MDPYADDSWYATRRRDQTPPPGCDWTTWLLLGGRGAGKTRAGAEWIRGLVSESPIGNPLRIALIAQSYGDAREVMIDGASGLRAIGDPAMRPTYEVSRRRLVWPSGAVGYCFSAEDPNGLRGYQFHAAWADEMCKWRYPEETWNNLQLALRLGDRPRQIVTTTPRPMALLKRLVAAKTTTVSKASTYANRANLAEAFFSEIATSYEGTRLGRQELLGELIDDLEGALWTWAMIEASRISLSPDLDRIVVAVDPPAGVGGHGAGNAENTRRAKGRGAGGARHQEAIVCRGVCGQARGCAPGPPLSGRGRGGDRRRDARRACRQD